MLCSLDDAPVRFVSSCRRKSWNRRSCRPKRRRFASRRLLRRSDTRRPSSIATRRRAKKAWSATKKSLLISTSSKNCSTMSASLYPKRRNSAQSRELEAEIAQAKLDLSRAEVRAPFSGFVTPRTVNIGQRLRPNDNLFNLASFSPLFADVHLSENDTRACVAASRRRFGSAATTPPVGPGASRTDQSYVDQASGTVKVTVAIEPKPGFRPGAFVRVEIRTDTKADAIVIPKRALIEEDGQNYVYIAQNDTAKRTKVALGYQREGMVEIREGVRRTESSGRRPGSFERRRKDQGPCRDKPKAPPRLSRAYRRRLPSHDQRSHQPARYRFDVPAGRSAFSATSLSTVSPSIFSRISRIRHSQSKRSTPTRRRKKWRPDHSAHRRSRGCAARTHTAEFRITPRPIRSGARISMGREDGSRQPGSPREVGRRSVPRDAKASGAAAVSTLPTTPSCGCAFPGKHMSLSSAPIFR